MASNANVQPIPPGYHSVTPYLIIDGAAAAIDFYRRSLDAVELMRIPMPNGTVGHAEIRIGDSIVMLADGCPEMGYHGPKPGETPPVAIMVYVTDVDAVFVRAIEAGATEERPVTDQFYGDRSGTFRDPFGHRWHISTHIEDVTPEEMQRRMDAMNEQK